MRLICVSLVVALLCILLECFAPANAAFECGTFDGKFSCRSSPGAAPHGKNAPPPGTESPPPAETPPSGEGQLPPPGGETGGGSSVTPGPAGCPPSTELLGGKCVRYSASCRKPVGPDALVQSCAGSEEKLVCKLRPDDGMKECCCLVYDKL